LPVAGIGAALPGKLRRQGHHLPADWTAAR
jgi:hypothetical protein